MREFKIKHRGRTVDAAYFEPVGEAPFPAVILSHGYNSSMTDLYSAGEYFARQGIAAAAFNFCGGGLRDKSGFPTEEMTLTTEKQDLLAVFRHIRARDEVSRVFLFGSSQGGMVSALAAEELQGDIGGLMLQYPALCIPDDWRRKYPAGSDIPDIVEFWGMNLGREFITEACGMDMTKVIGSYRGNVLIMHGTADNIVPLSYSEWAAMTYKNARLELFPEEGHGFSEKECARMNEMCVDFIKENSK